ncbi:MAG: ABC transporter permease subunit [Methylobacteriaceae bacterium]|jgi:His/Glu/Gln/Arg/opine family amino acid ABC transporter permease subunit|nr:ABC transporter permease subunit [Methylobacteriaceae bacterium]
MDLLTALIDPLRDLPVIGVFIKLLRGLPMTLMLVVPSVFIGAVIASLLAFMRFSRNPLICGFARCYISIFRSVPLLVLLFIVYYGPGQFREFLTNLGIYWIFRSDYLCALVAFIINTSAYGAEIIRGAVLSINPGQIEAGRACGMSRWLLLRRIIIPIAFRHALPAYSNEFILMVKATALVSIVTLMDMTFIAIEMRYRTPAQNSTVLYCLAAIYFTINYVVAWLFKKVEYRVSAHLREPVTNVLSPDTQPTL